MISKNNLVTSSKATNFGMKYTSIFLRFLKVGMKIIIVYKLTNNMKLPYTNFHNNQSSWF